MIHLLLIRFDLQPERTRGDIFTKDSHGNKHDYICHSLEDTVRDKNKDGDLSDYGEGKIYGKTAIPYGTYDIIVKESPKRRRLFEKGKITKERLELPYILNVPEFTAVQLHSGTSEDDSLGCILVGYSRNDEKIWNSRQAEKDLVKLIKDNDPQGRATIEII